MSEFRNPNDPRDTPYDPNVHQGSAGWGWAAGAVFVIILIALAFGVGRNANQAGPHMAANNPPMTQPAPAPSGPAGTAFSPPMNPSPANSAQPKP